MGIRPPERRVSRIIKILEKPYFRGGCPYFRHLIKVRSLGIRPPKRRVFLEWGYNLPRGGYPELSKSLKNRTSGGMSVLPMPHQGTISRITTSREEGVSGMGIRPPERRVSQIINILEKPYFRGGCPYFRCLIKVRSLGIRPPERRVFLEWGYDLPRGGYSELSKSLKNRTFGGMSVLPAPHRGTISRNTTSREEGVSGMRIRPPERRVSQIIKILEKRTSGGGGCLYFRRLINPEYDLL